MPPLAAILAWPFVSAAFFGRFAVPSAVLLTLFVGFLFLPSGITFDLPLLPTLDKSSVPAIAALCLALAFAKKAPGRDVLPGLFPKHPLMLTLCVGLGACAALMVLTNLDVLRYGPTVLAALRPYDAGSLILAIMVTLMPLLVGRKFFASPKGHEQILWAFVICGLGYSLLVAFEARMSPQLNIWIYGYFPHSYLQHIRASGWRPVVFLSHGLMLALFYGMCVIAAVALLRISKTRKSLLIMAALWLFFTLTLVKSLGAVLIALSIVPLILFLNIRLQLIFAAFVAAMMLIYPATRSAGLVPVDRIQAAIAQFNPERAASMGTRLEHEDAMLAKANQRPLFGWGLWGRWRVYDEDGLDKTISDGYWIITLGEGGWGKYIAEFGLLTLPIFIMLLSRRRQNITLPTSALCLLMAANLIDLIPNAGMTTLTWLIAGALWGRLEWEHQTDEDASTQTVANTPVGYRRQFPDRAPEGMVAATGGSGGPEYTRQAQRVSINRSRQ